MEPHSRGYKLGAKCDIALSNRRKFRYVMARDASMSKADNTRDLPKPGFCRSLSAKAEALLIWFN